MEIAAKSCDVSFDGTYDDNSVLNTKLRRLGFTVIRLPVALVERQLPVALQSIREAIAALSSAP